MKTNEDKLPWYLKKTPFFIIAACFPPLAYVLVFLYWNKLDKETKEHHFVFASLFLLIYSIEWMPRTLFHTFIVIGIYVFIWALTISALSNKFKKK